MLIRNNLLILSSVILFSACATPQPGIKTVIQREEVPIAVPCKAIVPTAPAYNFDKLTTDKDLYAKTQALLADRLLSLGYESELSAALNSCIK